MRERRLPRGDQPKRALDASTAALALLLVLPVLLLVALLVRLRLGGPILFCQQRAGLGGRLFTLYKFRTMLDVDEARGLVTDAERLTPFGRALRSTSLDELPGLVNVLVGDMSLVGPRPLLAHYLNRYTAEQARRHEVRPGITGLAQVRGRNAACWEDRLRWDVEYVDTRSALLDLMVLLMTIKVVLRRTGVSAPGHATVDEFPGAARAMP